MKRKATGRPPIVQGENTIRASMALNESLWKRFTDEADHRGVNYSQLFREILEERYHDDYLGIRGFQ